MTITTVPEFKNSSKQFIQITKTATSTTVASNWFTVENLGGFPSGALSTQYTGTSLTNGQVPTDVSGGINNAYPTIDSFGAGNLGYLSQIEFSNTVACRMKLYDTLFIAGSYNTSAAVNQTLTSQPSFASRIVGGSYVGLQIWGQVVTALGGALTVTVSYTNEAGQARTTSTTLQGAARRMFRFPFTSGDNGVQSITNVQSVTGGGGLYNILIMRPIWSGRVRFANDLQIHAFNKTAMKRVFDTSALTLLVQTDTGSTTGLVDVEAVIVNG